MQLTVDDTAAQDEAISTHTGRSFRPLDPQPEQIALADLAHGLSNVCRGAGQTAFFYSVSLHSIHVTEELARNDESELVQFYGLLHDAAEAYVTDVPSPLKRHLPGYREIEDDIQAAVWAAFDVDQPSDEQYRAVKRADRALGQYELPELFPQQTWEGERPDLDYDLRADARFDVPRRFEAMAGDLAGRVGASVPT
jgi:hypothetical protein